MKFKLILTTLVLAIGFLFFGCGDSGGDSDSPDVELGKIGEQPAYILAASESAKKMDSSSAKTIIFYYRTDGNYNAFKDFWLWVKTANNVGADYPVEWKFTDTATKVAYIEIDSTFLSKVIKSTDSETSKADMEKAIKEGSEFGLIVKPGTAWTNQSDDIMVDLKTTRHHLIVAENEKGGTGIIALGGDFSPSITSAVTTAANKVKVSLSVTLGLETSQDSNGFILKNKDGSAAAISVIDAVNFESQNNRNHNNAKNILLTLSSSVEVDKEYYLCRDGFSPENGILVSMQGAVKDSPTYSGEDLGLTLSGNKATFKVWAPAASDVKLLVYSSADDVGNFSANAVSKKEIGATTDETLKGNPAKDPIQMAKDNNTGVWSVEVDDVSAYKYYKYQIKNANETYYVCDIYAKSASADAIAAQIVDINKASEAIPSSTTDKGYGDKSTYYNPFKKGYTDAVIYEMHITDWSYAEDSDTKDVGKYLTIANGTKVIEHLKEIGVTHVQILPVFEFAETNTNTKYNWGYNPYHYNVPEGRYVTTGYKDGTQAVLELRTLIAKLHEAGIAVNMDVVYNHTSGTGAYSLYDSQVPSYFYRLDETGNYSNGSGCGNEIDSEAKMVKEYIIDSLKHWMLDYHFNGFRFDLMGCLSKETMTDIYDALHEIDPNVMVYGEPWTGGTSLVVNGASQAAASGVAGAGAFDDDFRDAIKGAEFGGFKQGQVQGTFNDTDIQNGLIGTTGKNKRNETGNLGLALHYVECHDNYTLFDKLAISYLDKTSESGDLFNKIGDAGLVAVKAQDKLAAAYIFLSQGTAFINGGQEFLRTKRGNENSYNTSGVTNKIDLSFKTKYIDVYNTYKGLIALRKANPSAFGSNNKDAKAETVSTGVTKYTTGDFLVYFNATDEAVDITTTGYTKAVDVSSGTPTESATLPAKVAAKSFVILKK